MRLLSTGQECGLPGHGVSRDERGHPLCVHKPKTQGEPPVKQCPKCLVLILASCVRCPDCGFAFSACASPACDDSASGAAALSSEIKQLLCTRHKPSASAGGRHPLRTPAVSAMVSFAIGVLGRYQGESRSA